MPLKIMRHKGGSDYEKMAEFYEGEWRGHPKAVESLRRFGEGDEVDEEEVKESIDGPEVIAQELDPEEDRIGWFVDPEYEPENPEYKQDEAAEKIADTALESLGGGTGNLRKLDNTEYEDVDDALKQMHERLAEWDGGDLSKAPPVWDSDEGVPEYVERLIRAVVDGDIVWDKFEGYSRRAAERVQDSLEENLSQPQGWSLRSLVEDLQDMFPGMDEDKAMNIARTETSAILNSAREEAYERREDSDDYVYYWQGPSDDRTTPVCSEIKEEVEARGGSVPMEELREILRDKARKYHDTRGGGTPERVDEWTPHYQCRHTFLRDVKADL